MARIVGARYLDNQGRARLAMFGVGLDMLTRALVAAYFGWFLWVGGRVGDPKQFLAIGKGLDFAGIGAVVVGGTLFLRWFRRAYENAIACGLRSVHSPGWAITAWFVPFLNLVEPAKLTAMMWGQAGQQRVGSASLVAMWWGTWWLSNLLLVVLGNVVKQAKTPDAIQIVLALMIGGYALGILAGGILLVIVQRLQRAHVAMRALVGVEAVFGEADGLVASGSALRPASAPQVRGERQVQGSTCAACGGSVDEPTEAAVCTACDVPFHDRCLREGACPRCRRRDLDVGFARY